MGKNDNLWTWVLGLLGAAGAVWFLSKGVNNKPADDTVRPYNPQTGMPARRYASGGYEMPSSGYTSKPGCGCNKG